MQISFAVPHEAGERLCFCYIDSVVPLIILPKSEISSWCIVQQQVFAVIKLRTTVINLFFFICCFYFLFYS